MTTTTTTIAAPTTTKTRKIKRYKTCDRCGIERRTMYTRQEPNSSFAWAEPYKELCPNCYLQEEEEKKRRLTNKQMTIASAHDEEEQDKVTEEEIQDYLAIKDNLIIKEIHERMARDRLTLAAINEDPKKVLAEKHRRAKNQGVSI